MSRFLLFGMVSFFTCATGLFGAPKPPNDDFVNRTVLEGNYVKFSGTLAGASYEPKEAYLNAQTVWWSWTATETAPVTIEFWNIRRATPPSYNAYTSFTIYSPSNLALGFPTNDLPVSPVARMVFPSNTIHPTLTFTGYAGQAYQIQLAGANSGDYEMSLTATNNPIILQHPQTASAAEHENALFTVAAVGALPLNYQWLKGGAPMTGETGPTLAITNLSALNAGDYSVILSNGFGASTSVVAHLFVGAMPQAPRLDYIGRVGTNGMSIGFTGEPGRFYQVQTTSDFVHWTTATNFVSQHLLDPSPVTTSFLFCSNGPANFEMPPGFDRQFVRVVRYTAANEGCVFNLKQFRFLKNLWAMQWNKIDVDSPMDSDLFIYKTPKPQCPQGGLYTLDSINRLPRCSIPGHVLQEPQ